MDKYQNIMNTVKDVVLHFDPDAKIILYGSRARGDYSPESDWDFLILLNCNFNEQLKTELRHRLYEIEWETGEVISSIIHKHTDWINPRNKITPFYNDVTSEGISI
ncbi:hypothetical protein ES705_17037 [subsurface metagenome]